MIQAANMKNLAAIVGLQSASFGLDQHFQYELKRLEENISSGQPEHARATLELLLTLAGCKQLVADAANAVNGSDGRPLYVCSAWFMRDYLRQAKTTRKESMCYVSGIELGRIRTLDRQLLLQYSNQTEYQVVADRDSNRTVLRDLDAAGQHLLAWFHSHPGNGQASTQPSAIDMSHQGDLEQGGYPVIGAVFTRDGHARFFSAKSEFDLVVLGKGIEQVDEKLYKISNE